MITKFGVGSMDRLIGRCAEVMAKKGRDYSGTEDPLANIKRTAERLGVSPRVVLGTYLSKQVDAVFRYLKDGTLDSEGIESRMVDVVNYVLLLSVMVEETREPHVINCNATAEAIIKGDVVDPTDPKYGTVSAVIEKKVCRGCGIDFNAMKDYDGGMCFVCRQKKPGC